MSNMNQEKTKMVPFPSHSIVPERDVDKRPILEARHLGIDFGGLTAVEDFNMIVGRTEICGLIGPKWCGKNYGFQPFDKSIPAYQRYHPSGRNGYL